MKRYLIITFLLIINFVAFADRIDDIIENTEINLSLENATAINLFTEVSITINDDLTYERHVFYIKKILTYKGKKRYSDVTLDYFPDYESIQLNECFTIDTEGNRIPIPENHIYDLDELMSSFYPEYIHRKQKTVNFPQIEPGYYIVMDYTVTNTRKKLLSGVEHLMESNPYINKEFTIIYPDTLKLKSYYPLNKNITHKEKFSDNNHIQTWSVHNMPLIKKENDQPSYLMIGCPIVYSFYDNWQYLARQKLSKLKPQNISAEIVKITENITKNLDTDDEKMLAIYKYMAKNFTTKYSLISEIDFTPLDLDQIIEQKYGSDRDMVALFLALANVAKIKDVYPAIVLNSYERFSEIQPKYAIDEFITDVCIYKNGKLFKPGNDKIPFAFANINEATILFGYDKIEIIDYHYELDNVEYYNYKYFLTDVQTLEEINAEVSGMANTMMRYRYQNETEDKRKIWFNNELKLKSAKLTDGPHFDNFDNIAENLRYNYTLQFSDLIVQQDKYTYFKINEPQIKLDVSKQDREYDFLIGSTINKKTKTTLKLYEKYKLLNPPIGSTIKKKEETILELYEKYKLLNPPDDFEVNFKIGAKEAYYKFKTVSKRKKVVIISELYIPAGIISQNEYSEFRQFILAIKNSLNSMVIFEK